MTSIISDFIPGYIKPRAERPYIHPHTQAVLATIEKHIRSLQAPDSRWSARQLEIVDIECSKEILAVAQLPGRNYLLQKADLLADLILNRQSFHKAMQEKKMMAMQEKKMMRRLLLQLYIAQPQRLPC